MAGRISDKIDTTIKYLSGNTFRRQAGVFLIFICISAVLWVVTSLNEEVQRHVDCKVNITHVPDSVTFIKMPPVQVEARVRGRGTHMLRSLFGSQPVVNIDFDKFGRDDRLVVTSRDLVQLVQSTIGDERLIQNLTPDSIVLPYTTLPPVRVPVKIEVTATTRPNVCLYGHIKANIDSVDVYSTGNLATRVTSISTSNLHLENIGETTVVPVKLIVPRGCRVIPDTVRVTINVEPVVTVTRPMTVTPVNVPHGMKVILSPDKVNVSFRMPRSQRDKLPEVDVIADFESFNPDSNQDKVAVSTAVWLPNVFIETDSVHFYLNDDTDKDIVTLPDKH